jgi:hypothetical protein
MLLRHREQIPELINHYYLDRVTIPLPSILLVFYDIFPDQSSTLNPAAR